jgi:DNA adenine methylase
VETAKCSYLGAKSGSGAYQAIISQFPPHDVYIDPFLGSGAIMRLKPPALLSFGLDLDAGCIAAFDYEGLDNPPCLICGDAFNFIANYDYAGSARVLMYLDPPYLLSTRGLSRYKYDFTEQDHVDLLNLIRTIPVSIVISGYPSSLYDDLLYDWRTLEFQSMSRGGVRTEKLWMNYPSDAVHWHTYAGSNFLDRQRIKRKAQRWADNFAALPPAERLAILNAMLNVPYPIPS